ncbi:MAG: nucleoside triphosphate pyrophosphohydrolase [Thermodesulfobacteriota bacterium]|nr:nucleoside triphosphate pyrophosphohydrolase [Thermodesulfobacteriota bacterium]
MKRPCKTNQASFSGKKHNINHLLAIMARLRSPSGCPWDREQTENSLKKFLIEEAYEVLETIETNDPEGLKEELGDLLLQIIFLSRIAEEKGQFNFLDVVHTLAEKLVRRHPHVFSSVPGIPGKSQPEDAKSVVKIWKSVKENEHRNAGKTSLLDGLPLSLPALERAQRMSERASRAGFDWPDIHGVWEKVLEELSELKKAGEDSIPWRVEEELGDLFFTLINWARFQGISAEEALRKTNRRFAHRFRQVELDLKRKGRTPEESTLKEMDELWNKAKKGGRRKA